MLGPVHAVPLIEETQQYRGSEEVFSENYEFCGDWAKLGQEPRASCPCELKEVPSCIHSPAGVRQASESALGLWEDGDSDSYTYTEGSVHLCTEPATDSEPEPATRSWTTKSKAKARKAKGSASTRPGPLVRLDGMYCLSTGTALDSLD